MHTVSILLIRLRVIIPSGEPELCLMLPGDSVEQADLARFLQLLALSDDVEKPTTRTEIACGHGGSYRIQSV